MPEAEIAFGEVMPHYIIFKCFLLQTLHYYCQRTLASEKSINFLNIRKDIYTEILDLSPN